MEIIERLYFKILPLSLSDEILFLSRACRLDNRIFKLASDLNSQSRCTHIARLKHGHIDERFVWRLGFFLLYREASRLSPAILRNHPILNLSRLKRVPYTSVLAFLSLLSLSLFSLRIIDRSNILNYKTFILQNDRISTMIQSFLQRFSSDRAVIIIFLYERRPFSNIRKKKRNHSRDSSIIFEIIKITLFTRQWLSYYHSFLKLQTL